MDIVERDTIQYTEQTVHHLFLSYKELIRGKDYNVRDWSRRQLPIRCFVFRASSRRTLAPSPNRRTKERKIIFQQPHHMLIAREPFL